MTKLISLCMIVKDEENVLDRCLKSVHQYVDEIIIVDTGSTDSTKSIANKYTDKVYDFKWCNDFSAARNEALKYASGKWILVLDADEYFEEDEIQKIRAKLSDEQPAENIVYNISIISFMGNKHSLTSNDSPVGRIFANNMGIRYSRPIHEQPVSIKGLEMKSKTLPARVYHSGYEEETITSKNKHDRNLSIFKQIEKQTGLTAYDHLQLGNQYTMMRQYDKAMNHLQKALKNPLSLGTAYKQVLFSIIQVQINTGKFIDAMNFYDEYLTAYTKYPDIQTIRGIILLNLGFMDMAKEAFLSAVKDAESRASTNESSSIVSPDTGLRLPLWQLAYLFEQDKNFPEALSYLTKLLIANPKEVQALTKLLEILTLKEQTSSIVAFIEKLLNPDRNPLLSALLCKISLSIGHAELAAHYSKSFPYEQTLKMTDLLRFSILTNQPDDFEKYWSAGSEEEQRLPTSIRSLILAALVWEKYEWMEWCSLESENTSYRYMEWVKNLVSGAPFEDVEQDSFASDLLCQLYSVGQFDTFDRLIDNLSSAKVINDLANFFYTKHHTDTAVQYYSHLIEMDGLDAESCTHLAILHISQNLNEDALPFLEKAISLEPKRRKLYVQYCLACEDSILKEQMKQRLIDLDPQYDKLPIFKKL